MRHLPLLGAACVLHRVRALRVCAGIGRRVRRAGCSVTCVAFAELEALLVAERATRDAADRISMPGTRRVVDSVMGDQAEGPDGPLYEAMGFVRASENRRGLVRRVGRRKA
jgi:hypothetical protein